MGEFGFPGIFVVFCQANSLRAGQYPAKCGILSMVSPACQRYFATIDRIPYYAGYFQPNMIKYSTSKLLSNSSDFFGGRQLLKTMELGLCHLT